MSSQPYVRTGSCGDAEAEPEGAIRQSFGRRLHVNDMSSPLANEETLANYRQGPPTARRAFLYSEASLQTCVC